MPRYTRERRFADVLASPVDESAVPVSALANVLMTHTGVPPDDRGSGGPNMNTHGCPDGQSAFTVHELRLLKQFFGCVGPVISQLVSLLQSQVGTQSLPLPQSASTSQTACSPFEQRRTVSKVIEAPRMRSELCATPVHPESRSDPVRDWNSPEVHAGPVGVLKHAGGQFSVTGWPTAFFRMISASAVVVPPALFTSQAHSLVSQLVGWPTADFKTSSASPVVGLAPVDSGCPHFVIVIWAVAAAGASITRLLIRRLVTTLEIDGLVIFFLSV